MLSNKRRLLLSKPKVVPFSYYGDDVNNVPTGLVVTDGGNKYQVAKKTCKFIDQSSIPHYYCDSVGGLDSNDGLSELTPKQTVSAIKALAVSSCVLEFKRGSYFRDELSGLPDNVVVKAYGTGARPIFDCADVVTTFTKTGGYTNVYQKTFSNNMTDASKSVISLWENGNRMKRVTSIALVDSTPMSFYGIGSGSGTDTVYFHATSSENPNSNGALYETSAREFGVEASVGSEIYDMEGRRNGHQYGSIVGTKYIKGCLAVDGNVHNMWNGGIAEDCECYIAEGGSYGSTTLFITYEHSPSPNTSVYYKNCVARGIETARFGWNRTGVTGFAVHTNGAIKFDKVVYEDCFVKDVQSGFTTQDTMHTVHRKCTVENFINAYTTFRNSGGKTSVIKCKALEKNGASDRINTERAIFCDGISVDVFGCDVVMRRMVGGAIFSKATTINATGNTFYFGESEINVAMIYGDIPSGCPDFVNLNKNIVFNAKKRFIDLRDSVVINSDYNNIDSEANGSAQIDASVYTSFSLYKSATSQDQNSLIGVPTFVGSVRDGDLSISAGSVANFINSGSKNYAETESDFRLLNVLNPL